MTYGELTSIQAFLRGLLKEKKLEVDELRKQAEKKREADNPGRRPKKAPACEPKLATAAGQYFRLQSLTETISNDLTSLRGVGPGDLFRGMAPKSAKLRAIEGIAEELCAINKTLSMIITYG